MKPLSIATAVFLACLLLAATSACMRHVRRPRPEIPCDTSAARAVNLQSFVQQVVTAPVLSRLYGTEIEVVRAGGRIFVMSRGQDVERVEHMHDHGHEHGHDHGHHHEH